MEGEKFAVFRVKCEGGFASWAKIGSDEDTLVMNCFLSNLRIRDADLVGVP